MGDFSRSGPSGWLDCPGMTEPSHPLLAATLDLAMYGLRELRDRVVPLAEGDVLELGVGTGLNLGRYARSSSSSQGVRSLTAIEPDPHMLKRARARAERLGLDVRFEQTGAEALPFDDASFDCVVATFVLCTIPDPAAALQEARRVLRPGGSLLFAEHVASSHRHEKRAQEWVNPLWSKVAGGCQLTRPAVQLVEEAGFGEIEHRPAGRQRFTLLPLVTGRARA